MIYHLKEETAYIELEDIQHCIRHSSGVVTKEQPLPPESSLPSALEESCQWMTVVPCVQMATDEKDTKKLKTDCSKNVDLFDIVRAFCHPRVIETVSQVLKE